MSVRFTSGGVGRFGFDEANATLDAADAMIGRFSDLGKHHSPEQPRPIVARLTQDLGESLFEPGPKGIKYRVWNWSQVQIGQGPTKKRIEQAPNGKTSQKFGDLPIGRAVQLGGAAIVGETVVLFKMMASDGRPWFAFNGRQVSVGTSTLLSLQEEPTEISPGKYRYLAQPIYINESAQTALNTAMPVGVAFNVYELSELHGQEVEFDNPPSRMLRDGPVKGPVVGVLANDPTMPPVYVFDATAPLIPECGGPVPGAFGNLLGGNL